VTLMLRTELFICFYARVLFLWHPPRYWMLRLCAIEVYDVTFRDEITYKDDFIASEDVTSENDVIFSNNITSKDTVPNLKKSVCFVNFFEQSVLSVLRIFIFLTKNIHLLTVLLASNVF
jgi:hypothetical protein